MLQQLTPFALPPCAGCQSGRLQACVPGAPNFRDVPGVGVYGGAIATVDGIRQVLAVCGAAPDAPPLNGRQVRWGRTGHTVRVRAAS